MAGEVSSSVRIAVLVWMALSWLRSGALGHATGAADPRSELHLAGHTSMDNHAAYRLRGAPSAFWRRRLLEPYHMSLENTGGLTLSVPVPKAYSFPINTELDTRSYYFIWVSGVYQLAYDIKLSHAADVYLMDEDQFAAWRNLHREPWLFTWQDTANYCHRCTRWKAVADVNVDTKWYVVVVNHSRTEMLRANGLIVAHGKSDNNVHRLLLGADSAVIAAILRSASSFLSAAASVLTPGWLRAVI